ncbi:MAG: TetR/AcrR family transcriptional regulator [Campylobacterales bacterium]|nr:TetR/AcrR family transcriptional regulator [Campylobacterales bacterium]
MEKNTYHHGNLKEEFLKLSFDYIKENNIDNLTLKVLADATGTSRSAIYRHFKSKDDLIETMILQGFQIFDDTFENLLDTNIPLIDRFYTNSKKYIEFSKENPNLYRLLFGKKYAHIREEVISINDGNGNGFSKLKKAIEEGQKSGILSKKDSQAQTIVIWSSLHGLASIVIDGFLDVDENIDTYLEAMFESLLSGSISNNIKIISTIPFLNKVLQPKSK